MNKLRDIIRYICKSYPLSSELSNARLTKMVFLSDWEFAKSYGRQLTDIEWYFHNYGPYVDDIKAISNDDPSIVLVSTTTVYGTHKLLIELKDPNAKVDLTEEERKTIDKVIEATRPMYWNSFIKHVYDTYPIRTTPRHSTLDLVELAKKEKNETSAH